MKKLIFLLLLPAILEAQDVPDKKSTVIVVRLDVSPEVGYREAARALMDEGFEIESSDPGMWTLKTGWRNDRVFVGMSLFAEVRESGSGCEVRIRGTSRQNNLGAMGRENSEYQITPRYNAGKDWKLMEAVADRLAGEKSYL